MGSGTACSLAQTSGCGTHTTQSDCENANCSFSNGVCSLAQTSGCGTHTTQSDCENANCSFSNGVCSLAQTEGCGTHTTHSDCENANCSFSNGVCSLAQGGPKPPAKKVPPPKPACAAMDKDGKCAGNCEPNKEKTACVAKPPAKK